MKKYISHGAFETGGYRLEKSLCENLGDVEEFRFRENYRGILGWIRLFFLSFSAAKADVVITVARLAWPVFLRNLFSKNKMILVLHNYDITDGKPGLYYRLLDIFLRKAAKKPSRIALVVVAKYWSDFLKTHFGIDKNVFLFPNTFPMAKLAFYRDVVTKNKRLIHLGQYSGKIDKKAYRLLIHTLEARGFGCYFSSERDLKNVEFPITVFNTHEAYLKQMALSAYTVILNSIDEGWNRVAHESFLVGTQVIAFPKGGLKELVETGNGFLVQDVQEAIGLIISETQKNIDEDALEAFDASHTREWAKPIQHWLEGAG